MGGVVLTAHHERLDGDGAAGARRPDDRAEAWLGSEIPFHAFVPSSSYGSLALLSLPGIISRLNHIGMGVWF